MTKEICLNNHLRPDEAYTEYEKSLILDAMEEYATAQTAELQKEVERLKGKMKQLYTMYNRDVMFPDKLEQHWQQFKTDNNL